MYRDKQYIRGCLLGRAQSLQLCLTLCDLWTVAHQAPLSMGFSRQKILEWVVMSSSQGSSQPRNQTHISSVSCTAAGSFPTDPPGKLQGCLGQGKEDQEGNSDLILMCIEFL